MSELKSFKLPSMLVTLIVTLCICITTLGTSQLTSLFPEKYAWIISIVVTVAGQIVNQYSENKRVDVAEDLVLNKFGEGVCVIGGEKFPVTDFSINNVIDGDDDGC